MEPKEDKKPEAPVSRLISEDDGISLNVDDTLDMFDEKKDTKPKRNERPILDAREKLKNKGSIGMAVTFSSRDM